MEKKISVKTLYLLMVISLGLVGLGIGSTYAVFTASAEIDSPISLSSNLTYDSNILETVDVTVGGGETISTTLNITNSNDNTLKYVTWYVDGGKDVEVVGEDGNASGTVASGSTSSIIVSVRNYTYESATVTIGISSSNDSVVLSNDMKQVEDVNFLMSLTESEKPTDTTALFLNSNLQRSQIETITFVDNINVPSGNTSVDVSKHGNGSVIMWYGTANDSGNYDVYIGSNRGKTYLDSGYYLLSYLSNCTAINLNDILDVSKSISLQALFISCENILTLDVAEWDTSNVQNMRALFAQCLSLQSLDIADWKTGNVTTMRAMFNRCSVLQTLSIDNWNVSNVSDMAAMFQRCNALTQLDLSSWDVSSVTSMETMFSSPSEDMSLVSVGDLSNWNTSNVTTMKAMFQHCALLTSVPGIQNWNVSNVTDMSYMFAYCKTFDSLNLLNWNTNNVTDMKNMFNQCTALTSIYVSDKWSVSNVTSSDYMFNNCTSLVGGAGTTYNSSYIDKTYAIIDEGTSNPGYLTKRESV